MTTALAQAIETLGLSIRAEFVPFSQSRNAASKDRSLNWRVTLVRRTLNADGDARYSNILTTDYSAGIAHCPAYNRKMVPTRYPYSLQRFKSEAIESETEYGEAATWQSVRQKIGASGGPLLPDATDVIYSLVMDASVLDAGTFEDWAGDAGYDTDSRAAEATYRACLDIALQLRASLGASALETLATAAQDY